MADNATEDKSLTSSDNFDINEVIARAIAAEAEAPDDTSPDDAADGPDSDVESGELPAETSDDAEETETQAPDGEPEAQTEQPASEPEPVKAAPPPPPENPEVAALRDLVAQQSQAIRDLLAATQQKEQPQAAPAKVPENVVRAVELALYGGEEGSAAWKALSPQDQAQATVIAREHFKREAKAAVDPTARYEAIREQVLLDVAKEFGPLVQDFYDRQAANTFETVAKSAIKDPTDKKRLQELYSQHPGSRGRTLAEQKTALETAAARLDIERQKKDLEAREQKLVAKSRDSVNRKPPRPGNKDTSVRRSDAPINKRASWNEGESMADFVRKLEAMDTANA